MDPGHASLPFIIFDVTKAVDCESIVVNGLNSENRSSGLVIS